MVADDDSAVRRVLGRWLQALGWSVETFESGEALVAACRRLPPDLVVSDVNMPGSLDGLEACRTIRRELPRTRIIVMTGDPGNLPAARAAGFELVLGKPFRLSEVKALAARPSRRR